MSRRVNNDQVCFAEGHCLPLTPHIPPPNQDKNIPQSLDIMKAAEDLSGLRLIACDSKRNCKLFSADIDQNALTSFRLKAWDWEGKHEKIYSDDFGGYTTNHLTTSFEYSSLYIILPSGCVNEFIPNKDGEKAAGGLFQYMGCDKDLLSKRESALFEMRDDLVGQFLKSDFFKKGHSEQSNNVGNKLTDGNADSVTCPKPNPFQLWLQYGIDFFTTPSSECLMDAQKNQA